jgi:replication factor A1
MGPSCGSYPSGGDKLSSVALSEKPPVWKLVGQIKDENLGYSDKPDLITVKATISSVTELLYHVACPLAVNGKRCNAKATSDVDGTWRCGRCGYSFLEPCKYGCSVRIQIQDHTGTASAMAYEVAAEEILGCRAKDLYSMNYKEHDHAQLDDIIQRAVGKQYVFQLKVERQLLSRVKCLVLKAEKVNPSAESRRLLGQINTLLLEGSVPGSEIHSHTMPTYTGLQGAAFLQLQ